MSVDVKENFVDLTAMDDLENQLTLIYLRSYISYYFSLCRLSELRNTAIWKQVQGWQSLTSIINK